MMWILDRVVRLTAVRALHSPKPRQAVCGGVHQRAHLDRYGSEGCIRWLSSAVVAQDCYPVDSMWVAGRRTHQLGQRRPQSQSNTELPGLTGW
jgi:hypothetical protein